MNSHISDKKIGLFGLSANPPHYGHVKMAQYAKSVLGLDEVWWIVAAHNPLKDAAELAPFEDRVKMCEIIADDYKWLKVSDVEQRLGLNKSFDVIKAVVAENPENQFTWIIGGDNLVNFHKWYKWQDILNILPVAVMARPGQMEAAARSPAYGYARTLPENPFTLLDNPLVPISSTALRQNLNAEYTNPKVIDHIRQKRLYP